MRPRVTLGRFLNRFGRFIQSLDIMVMRPQDLVEYTRQTYSRPKNVESWTRKDLIDSGLTQDEKILLENIPLKEGRLLLLGIGGGREAIPLAKRGFRVTGVDFVPDMVKKAKKNALKHGIEIKTLVQEISKLNVPASYYNIAWLSAAMYSSFPTRKKRVEMLRRIHSALNPEGYFLCEFHFNPKAGYNPEVEILRKIFAFLTFGNLMYEKGDMLLGNTEFIHSFPSEESLKSEFEEGGFKIIKFHLPEERIRGGAVLRKEFLSNG